MELGGTNLSATVFRNTRRPKVIAKIVFVMYLALACAFPSTNAEVITTLINTHVTLTCDIPRLEQDIQWTSDNNVIISTCSAGTDGSCENESTYDSAAYDVTRNRTTSSLKVTRTAGVTLQLHCKSNVILQSYNVTFIDEPNISPLNCSIIPPRTQHKENQVTFSCEAFVSDEIIYRLSMFGLNETISMIGISKQNITRDVVMDELEETLDVSCQLSLDELGIFKTCTHPQYIHVSYELIAEDAVFECHVNPGDHATWRLLDPEGQEEDITGRSWTRDEGRFLLIKNIIGQDLGKVAECRTNGSVGFGVVDEVGSSENNGYNDSTETDGSHRDRSVYVVLTFVFGGLLLLTLLIVISHWRCGACEHPMKWCARYSSHGTPKISAMNQLSGSTGPNNVDNNAESNPDSNQNNSALNHPRDPTFQMKATSSSVAAGSSSVHPDQPVVDTNQHTYFCVERSTPPPSLPDLSTSGSMTIYQDPDYEESQRQRLRDSAGYDVVDASKKKMNNNPDMDDYAEVGGAYDMTSNPAIAPRSSKGWTGKGVVMSSDPAVLYGKVNK